MTALEERALKIWQDREKRFPPRVRRAYPDDIDRATGAWDRCLVQAQNELDAEAKRPQMPAGAFLEPDPHHPSGQLAKSHGRPAPPNESASTAPSSTTSSASHAGSYSQTHISELED